LPGDWIAGVGFHRSKYARLESQTRTFSLERHWGNFGAGYTLFSGKPEASGASAPAHRFQFSYQYSDLSSVGLAYSTGREFDGTPANGLYSTDVRNWTLSGRHWFARDWAVTYEALTERYGNLYRREGLRLGLRYRF
jgi:YaiO family outer membrane protein